MEGGHFMLVWRGGGSTLRLPGRREGALYVWKEGGGHFMCGRRDGSFYVCIERGMWRGALCMERGGGGGGFMSVWKEGCGGGALYVCVEGRMWRGGT